MNSNNVFLKWNTWNEIYSHKANVKGGFNSLEESYDKICESPIMIYADACIFSDYT